jgi:hypothetical protein
MSRLTFRSATNDVAWQKQLRDKYNSEGAPTDNLSLKNSVVRPIGRSLAKQIIYKYEWLGTMSATSYHFGIFFGDYCAGVTCVGGSNCVGGTNVHSPFNIKRNELLILARGANVHWSPPGANSKLVSWTCKLLSKVNRWKVIIAYSDTDAGEIGTIYQACNWAYIGAGSSTMQWVSPIGRVHDAKHPSNLRARQGNKYPRAVYVKLLKNEGWYEQPTNPKHRYVYVLDKRDKKLAQLVEGMRKPYPKREDKHAGD